MHDRDSWEDPTHIPGTAELHWTTDNVGEALPGATTPLGWSIWSDTGDRMIRESMYALGIYNATERAQPARLDDRIIQPFNGRVAIRIEWLASVGDRMPGTTGSEAVASMLGRVPETLTFHPTRRRYPAIAGRLPIAAITAPRRLRAQAPIIHDWWRNEVSTTDSASHEQAIARFTLAHRRFEQVMTLHTIALMSSLTPLLQALTGLIERSGVGDLGALSGAGGTEMGIVSSIWRASRGEITAVDVAATFGYHGPLEGEISSRVWREDPTPLKRMIAGYASKDDSENPALREERARRLLPELQRELVAALPRTQRTGARLLLRHAARNLPLRGVGKASFLQALDVARACARRAGTHLAEGGTIAHPDDVFYLTVPELTGNLPTDTPDVIAQRRKNRLAHQQLTLPASWRGSPEVQSTPRSSSPAHLVSGIGASAGVVEGLVRVITDPSFADVEPGEVLVSHTTDPSWASIMFLSSALVVDIGGVISHAAVVARELGIPCVVNTRTGTQTLRTGDRVRVNGSTGSVEVLTRFEP